MGPLQARRADRREVPASAPDEEGEASEKKDSSVLEKLARVNAKRRRDLADGVEFGAGFPVLYFADKALMLAGIGRERGLRQPLGLAQAAHVLCQYGADA